MELAGSPHGRFQTSGYDDFRLVDWKAEHPDGSTSPHPLLQHDLWDLDLLGNWGARETSFASGPNLKAEHSTDGRNEIFEFTKTVGTGTPEDVPFYYDAAGNLLFDGDHVYQYDAWNRLIQVNEAEFVPPGPQPDPLPPLWGVQIGAMLKHYTYDALGRLIRTQSPYPDPQLSGGMLRSERFYYDGIRRIQEVFVDPLSDSDSAQSSPELSLMAASTMGSAVNELDGASSPAVFEVAQTGDDDPGDPGEPLPSVAVWLDREYVWGPGDVGTAGLMSCWCSSMPRGSRCRCWWTRAGTASRCAIWAGRRALRGWWRSTPTTHTGRW